MVVSPARVFRRGAVKTDLVHRHRLALRVYERLKLEGFRCGLGFIPGLIPATLSLVLGKWFMGFVKTEVATLDVEYA